MRQMDITVHTLSRYSLRFYNNFLNMVVLLHNRHSMLLLVNFSAFNLFFLLEGRKTHFVFIYCNCCNPIFIVVSPVKRAEQVNRLFLNLST